MSIKTTAENKTEYVKAWQSHVNNLGQLTYSTADLTKHKRIFEIVKELNTIVEAIAIDCYDK